MKTLTVDKVGWKKLQGIIDVLIKAINRATPLKGDGISLSETDNGVIISIDLKSDDLGKALDKILTGWLSFTWKGVRWQDITIVDSSTCAESTVTVLTKDPSSRITIPLYFDPSSVQLKPPVGTDISFSIWIQFGLPA